MKTLVKCFMLIASLIMMNPPARADVFTIHDDTESPFVTHDAGTVTSFLSCSDPEDFCEIDIIRSGAFPTAITGHDGSTLIPVGPPSAVYSTRVDEPGGGQSDRYNIVTYADSFAQVFFFSDNLPGGGSTDPCFYNPHPLCASAPGYPELPSIVETGGVQLAGNIYWSDGSVDTINFISDVEAPEPGTLFLLGSGLLGLGYFTRRRNKLD